MTLKPKMSLDVEAALAWKDAIISDQRNRMDALYEHLVDADKIVTALQYDHTLRMWWVDDLTVAKLNLKLRKPEMGS